MNILSIEKNTKTKHFLKVSEVISFSFKLSMQEILKPAVNIAENGFPVQKITAHSWKKGILFVKIFLLLFWKL